jgi:hypothetical protein
MEESTKRNWDVVLGILGPILTLATILLGVHQFNVGERHKVELEYSLISRKDQIEFERKLSLDRLATYHAIVEIAGKIAAHPNDDREFKRLVDDFVTQYWGQAILSEDDSVQKAMIEFNTAVKDFQGGWIKTNQLRADAEALVKACRVSIEAEKKEAKRLASSSETP